jgi:hypothetical protein
VVGNSLRLSGDGVSASRKPSQRSMGLAEAV